MQTSNPSKQSAGIWLADLAVLGDECIPRLVSLLGPSEALRYGKFSRENRRRQFLLGRILLRMAVADRLGLQADQIGVTERRSGAPLLDVPATLLSAGLNPPHFSISHSGRTVAVAVSSDVPLGLDIELVSARRNYLEIARMAFDADENAWLQACREAERPAAFYRIWTRKEALYKLQSSIVHPAAVPQSWHENVLASRRSGRHFFSMTHGELSISLCSAKPLPAAQLKKFRMIGGEDLRALCG